MTTAARPCTGAAAYQHLADALAACPSVTDRSPELQDLMAAIWSIVCIRGRRVVVPMGSAGTVTITGEYPSTELIAVMDWLRLHEEQARALTPDGLFRAMRSIGTLGPHGSGRAARMDRLGGLVDVPAGVVVRWIQADDEDERCAS